MGTERLSEESLEAAQGWCDAVFARQHVTHSSSEDVFVLLQPALNDESILSLIATLVAEVRASRAEPTDAQIDAAAAAFVEKFSAEYDMDPLPADWDDLMRAALVAAREATEDQ